jgi:hypothetical protein
VLGGFLTPPIPFLFFERSTHRIDQARFCSRRSNYSELGSQPSAIDQLFRSVVRFSMCAALIARLSQASRKLLARSWLRSGARAFDVLLQLAPCFVRRFATKSERLAAYLLSPPPIARAPRLSGRPSILVESGNGAAFPIDRTIVRPSAWRETTIDQQSIAKTGGLFPYCRKISRHLRALRAH